MGPDAGKGKRVGAKRKKRKPKQAHLLELKTVL